MGSEGKGGARLLCFPPGAALEAAVVGVCRELEVAAAAAATAATGFGGSDGCPGRDPTAAVLVAPSSCRNLASMRAIFASVL